MLRFSHNNKAFSLLELLITIAIISTGITVILQAFSFASRVAGLSSDIIRADFLAEDKLQELEFKEKQGLIKQEPAQSSGLSDKFQWKADLGFIPDTGLYKLSFVVDWQRLNFQEDVAFNTYLR